MAPPDGGNSVFFLMCGQFATLEKTNGCAGGRLYFVKNR